MKHLFQRVLATVFAAAALAAHAGGPLSVCPVGSSAPYAPLKYPGAGTISLNYDLGNLGSRTNAQAAAIINTALATWTNVGTATVSMTRGANLPVDVTIANFSTYLGNGTFGDGLNPVVYDTDGSLTDNMLGTGANNSVLGFAGSAYNFSPCQYIEGRAVINGKIAVSDATMTTVLTHELGHFIGLDHTQLDGMQGLATANYPLMYPIAYRTAAGLHEDDIAAISAIYPDATVNTTYGTLTGTFVTAGGTPIQGANIWAQNTTTGQLFSVVSDYLAQGTGYFKLLLTPGTYTLHAEAIDRSFTGGSGIGPFSDDLTGASFQAPLYPGGGTTEMTPVTMSSQVTMTAGCAASITFRINGTSTTGAACGVASVMITPAAGSTLAGSAATFTWDAGAGIAQRYLTVGTTLGGSEIFSDYVTGLSRAVTAIPTTGGTIYVRLSSYIGGAWQTRSYTYTGANIVTPTRSEITSPPPGSTLLGSTIVFAWDTGTSVTARFLSVGTTPGGSQFYGADQGSALSRSVGGLPTDGSTVYVRLTSTVNGVAQNADYTYSSVFVPQVSTMTSPANGSVLASSSVTFNWTAGMGVTERYLMVGRTLGGSEIYAGYQGAGLSRTVTGIPQDGSTVYVRLMSWMGSGWQTVNYSYVAGTAPPPVSATPSLMTSPAAGSTLASSSITFSWSAGSGVTERYLMVGTSVGGSQIYAGYQGGGSSRTVAGISQDGSTVYVRLLSWINGGWVANDYTYVGGTGTGPAPSVITGPAPGSVIGSSVTLTWTAGSGVTERYLMVGSTVGGAQYYQAYQGNGTSRLVTGLPGNGATVYVRLMSYINGWQITDYTYH